MSDTQTIGGGSRLEVEVRRKAFRAATGGEVEVLGPLDLSLERGRVGALMGPSGCGKTTLLRIIAGLDTDFEGSVRLPSDTRLAMVFQEPRLLPWRTVTDNLALVAPEATPQRIDELIEALGLGGHRRHYPGELSLGLARRVALARAFAVEPDVLLLDEPFVSLDAALAAEMRAALARLVADRPVTVLLVTHDADEAIGLADTLFRLSPRPGRIVERLAIETPRGALSSADREHLRAQAHRWAMRAGR